MNEATRGAWRKCSEDATSAKNSLLTSFRTLDSFLAHDPHTSQTTRERTMGSKRGTTVANDYGGFRRRVMVAVLSY